MATQKESHSHLDCTGGNGPFFPEGLGLIVLLMLISGLLASSNPPASVTQVGGMTGLQNHDRSYEGGLSFMLLFALEIGPRASDVLSILSAIQFHPQQALVDFYCREACESWKGPEDLGVGHRSNAVVEDRGPHMRRSCTYPTM